MTTRGARVKWAAAVLALAAWGSATAVAIGAVAMVDGQLWLYTGVGNGGARVTAGPGCGDVVIPSELDCYPVTGIADSTFSGCTKLTSVTIPDSVTWIGSYAFSQCSGLTELTIPGSVTVIGSYAFGGCNGLQTLCVPLSWSGTTKVSDAGVPATCSVLYGDAWERVDGDAWSYVVSNGQATVTAGPRKGVVSIPSVLGGCPVTAIGSNAFYNCVGLKSVTIPDSVTSIGDRAFYQCSGLTNVLIGNGVTSIGSSAFLYCTNLTAVHISDLAAWCGIDFGGRENSNPLYYARHLYLNGEEVSGNLVIPNGVMSIGNGAFYQCSGLTNVLIGNGVTSIGSYAFSYCTNLTAVTIPDSVTNIGSSAFSSCRGLTNVVMGNGVTSIGYAAFSTCTNLTAVHISDLAAWCGIDFVDGENANPLYYARHLYLNGEEVLGNLVIPNGVMSIGNGAFCSCTNLTAVTIPDSVTNIGSSAFSSCRGLTNVVMGNGVTSIGDRAFSSCRGLTNIDIGNGVTIIGNAAFSSCTNLTEVMIPNSVTNIGTNSFYQYSYHYENGFLIHDYGRLATMYVPESWKSKYVNSTFWRYHAGVPPECEIIYYTPEEPAVTATGVPHGWLEENAGEALAAAGGDYEAAARAKAANGRKIWECYVAGLSTTNAAEEFTTEITFSNGVPKVSWEPDLNEGGKKKEREYVVEGKPGMMEEWGATNSESRFFRVKVEMP